ncbi:hypothetical protein GCM10010472_72480 [Pseudonocardia halophobica]|uniref:Uncharacterized protein n=1 Tax=Pseudonocardia halophobica TaxID=29401 RepID=A0A9W6L2D4_9PSEU|nr:hypothetical protein GCM10017577_20210 [Pseudonocardia halophobica]
MVGDDEHPAAPVGGAPDPEADAGGAQHGPEQPRVRPDEKDRQGDEQECDQRGEPACDAEGGPRIGPAPGGGEAVGAAGRAGRPGRSVRDGREAGVGGVEGAEGCGRKVLRGCGNRAPEAQGCGERVRGPLAYCSPGEARGRFAHCSPRKKRR